MQEKQKELFQSRIERLKKENYELKEKLASRKKEALDIANSLMRHETLLNSIPAGLVLIQEGKVIKTNHAILEDLGYKPEDIIGIRFPEIIHPDERENIITIHKIWESGRMTPDQYEARLVTSSGMPVFYEIRCSRIRYHNRTAFLIIATGIRERLEKEKEKIQKEKSEALFTMTAAVKDRLGLYSDILLEAVNECKAVGKPANKRLEETLKKLEKVSAKTIDVTERLEIIAGTGKGRPPQGVFSLNDAVRSAVQYVDKTFRERAGTNVINIGLKPYLRSSSLIEGDPKGITDAVSNIINNAVEAMSDGGDIYITTEDNNGDAHIYIQDDGAGIPDKFKDKIFDPFFTLKKGAAGLGLSMARSIIQRNGGDIDFTSRDGEGAIFHARFPVAGQKTAPRVKNHKKKIAGSQILIVQESDVAREVISHPLKIKGCRITKAVNAFEGLVKLKTRDFDMLIADAASLDMNTRKFIEKSRHTIPDLSIVLMMDPKARSGIDPRNPLKIDLIIEKPVDVNSAVKRLSAILAGRR